MALQINRDFGNDTLQLRLHDQYLMSILEIMSRGERSGCGGILSVSLVSPLHSLTRHRCSSCSGRAFIYHRHERDDLLVLIPVVDEGPYSDRECSEEVMCVAMKMSDKGFLDLFGRAAGRWVASIWREGKHY